MAIKIVENQLLAAKSWHGFTDKNHLVNALDLDPVSISDKLIQVGDVNLGEDFVSMIMKNGTHYIKPEKDILRWKLENAVEENYPLIGAYTDATMSTLVSGPTKFGANGTTFYMLFNNKPFSTTEVIVGNKPDAYQIWITEQPTPVGDNKFLYKVQLISNSEDFFIPASELAPGSRWSSEKGLVPDSMSYEGFDVSFYTHAMMETRLSAFRMQHTIPGRMLDVKPLGFFVQGTKGKKEMLWITNVEYALLKKARMATANYIMNSHSNVKADGTIMNVDKNGYTATSGAGFKKQWSSTNLHRWNLRPDLGFLTEIALDAVINKIPMGGRKMVIKAGEYGLKELSGMVMRAFGADAWKNSPWASDTSGRMLKVNGNELYVNMGQVMGVATINGIEFEFVVDPSKDHPGRNKMLHPLGGYASSYEYDIMGFGVNAKSNMQIVRREGQAPIFGEIPGMRSLFGQKATSFSNPKQIATPVDATSIHFFEPGIGAVVWDPTLVIRYYPDILGY